MSIRKVGSKIRLSPKALKIRPDLRGEIGVIAYRPVTVYPNKSKRGRIMYPVKFSTSRLPRRFGAFADEIRSA